MNWPAILDFIMWISEYILWGLFFYIFGIHTMIVVIRLMMGKTGDDD